MSKRKNILDYIELGNGIYIIREKTNRPNRVNSILIEGENKSESVLIDTNYSFRHIREFYTRLKAPAKRLYVSHCHLDHVAHVFYHEQKFGTPIFCPKQEENGLKSLTLSMEEMGYKKLDLEENYEKLARDIMKFQECENINIFNPGKDSIEFSGGHIETIHIPGHSPGQTAFIINKNNKNENKKVLYSSDIGSHPYYGDLNSNLSQYQDSINNLEDIYFSDDFILVPAHGNYYSEKQEEYFNKIRDRIKSNEEKILSALSKSKPKSIKDLVLEWIIRPQRISVDFITELFFLWDGGIIYHHLNDLIKKKIVEKAKKVNFLNDEYVLI